MHITIEYVQLICFCVCVTIADDFKKETLACCQQEFYIIQKLFLNKYLTRHVPLDKAMLMTHHTHAFLVRMV